MGEVSNSNGFRFPVNEDEEMSVYKKDAVSVVCFKISFTKDDLNSKRTIQFKPDMAHQIFGESESIFGYRSLSITLNYLHNSSRCYVDIQKSGEVRSSELCKPDDIMNRLNPWLPQNFTTKEKVFKKMLEDENHNLMFGTVLDEWKDKQDCKLFPNKKVSVNYKITACDTADEDFKEFHCRFETFIVWFIDAANFIDLDDERWMIFYVYEEFQHPETKETYCSPIGYCSVYKFYAYPSNIRARISQFFVLPSHQRRGIGSKLYQTVVTKIKNMPEAIDITVEEPTSTFKKIRDYNDCQTVKKELKHSKIDISSASQKKVFACMKKHKLCKRQCQRIQDILGSYEASKASLSAYQSYINGIKERIAHEIERETRVGKKMCNSERVGVFTDSDKQAFIENEFKRHIDDIGPSIKYLQHHVTDN